MMEFLRPIKKLASVKQVQFSERRQPEFKDQIKIYFTGDPSETILQQCVDQLGGGYTLEHLDQVMLRGEFLKCAIFTSN